jgi:phosphopantothenate synthetase
LDGDAGLFKQRFVLANGRGKRVDYIAGENTAHPQPLARNLARPAVKMHRYAGGIKGIEALRQ